MICGGPRCGRSAGVAAEIGTGTGTLATGGCGGCGFVTTGCGADRLTLLTDSLRGLMSCGCSLGCLGLVGCSLGVGSAGGIIAFGEVGNEGIGVGSVVNDGGTTTAWAIGIMGLSDSSSGSGSGSGMGFRKSAASILAVTASKSSMMYREGELLAELYSENRGVFSSHLLMSLSVCSVSNSRASILAPVVVLGCLFAGAAFGLMEACCWELFVDFCICFLLDSVLTFGGLGSFSTGDGIGVAAFGVGISGGESSTKSYSSLGSTFLSDSRLSVFSSL